MIIKTKTKRKLRNLFRIPQMSGSRLLIVAEVLAIIGIWATIAVRATTGYSVRFILFCAADQCSGSTTSLASYASGIRTWYNGQVGETFTLQSTTKITGSHNASWYSSNNFDTDKATTTIKNIRAELVDRGILNSTTVKNVLMLGFQSLGGSDSICGIAEQPGELALGDPLSGCSSHEDTVLAHELGHTYGFAHVSDSSNLMYATVGGYSLSSRVLNSSQESTLRGTGWFDPVPAGSVPQMLSNPGFEGSGVVNGVNFTDVRTLNTWHFYASSGNTASRASSSVARSGSYVAALYDQNSGSTAATQVVAGSAGAKYTVTGYSRWFSGSTGQTIYLDFLNSNFDRISEQHKAAPANRLTCTWCAITVGPLTAPSGTRYVRVILYGSTSNVSTFYWDTVTLAQN